MNTKQAIIVVSLIVVGAASAALILRLDNSNRPGAEEAHGADHDPSKPAEQRLSASKPGRDPEPGCGATTGSETRRDAAPEKAVSEIKISAAQQRTAGIEIAAATVADVIKSVSLPGEIRLNEDRTAHVVPRVAGVVESVGASLGQQVRKGQVLAVIASRVVSDQRAEFAAALRRLELARTTLEREKKLWEERISAEQDYLMARTAQQEAEIAVANARQKLAAIGVSASANSGNRFELRAPFDGLVIEKHVALGEAVKEDTSVFTLSDLSVVWANFNVAAKDLAVVRVGAKAMVRAPALDAQSTGTVSYVGSLIGESTRTAIARVTVPNPKGAWRPGLFVDVTLASSERISAVTVPNEALQTLDGQPHVFVQDAGGFSPRAVQLGTSDGSRTEIISGLAAGEVLAITGTFVLKSELEKSSSAHTH